jgi:hypothetical protein
MNDNLHQNEIGTGQRAAAADVTADDVPAWVMIENGRYQPQRIKGSCLGRELG